MGHTVVAAGDTAGRALAEASGPTFDVRTADDAATAREQLDGAAAVVGDRRLPDERAFDVFRAARERAPDRPCVLYADAVPEPPGEGAPIVDVVPRSEGPEALASRVRTAVERAAHTACPVPDDEPERGAVLDTIEPTARLDDVARDAARTLEADVAGVGLVERDRFRPLAFEGADPGVVPRSSVPCSYAVYEGEFTVVDRLHDDPRFAGRHPTAELGVRWYAGAPVTVAGQLVGAVGVYDRRRRTVEGTAREELTELAETAAARLSSRLAPR